MPPSSSRIFDAIAGRIKRAEEEIRKDIFDAVHDVARDGMEFVEDALVEAVTRTGILRANGQIPDPYGYGIAGRVESAHMWESIDFDAYALGRESVIGRFGWFNPESYFVEQEFGTDKIPAAGTLARARNEFLHDRLIQALYDIKKEYRA